jgi:hypothetical protein
MATSSTSWQKGQSGNPNGRPPSERALTQILEAAGSKSVEYQGKNVARKRVLAALLWEAATTGKTTMPSGAELQLGPTDWMAIVKMLYSQIDGPPVKQVDVTSGGKPITGYASVSPDDWDNEPTDGA